MAKYYQVKVELIIDTETGKTKKFPYLVEAVSPTDAEARITQYLSEEGEQDFEIKSAVESNIREVVQASDWKQID